MLAFERPWALVFLLAIPCLVALKRLANAYGPVFPFGPGEPPSTPHWPRIARFFSLAGTWLAVAALVVAVSGPSLVSRRTIYLSRGNEVTFVVDVSPSMAAADFSPTRLEASKAIIREFLGARRNETVGLVAFGKEAALICPPTADYDAFSSRLDTLVPGLFGDGTAIGDGIAVAVGHTARGGALEKHVVLLTDGENNAGSLDPTAAATIAERNGVVLSIVGVGSRGEVPATYADPATGQKKTGVYRSGFDRDMLERLARSGGGHYFAAENREGLAQAFAALSERASSLVKTRSTNVESPYGRYFLLVALAAFALARLFAVAGGGRP